MLIPLRVRRLGDGPVDLVVDVAPTCTVGELADELAHVTGSAAGGSIQASWPHDTGPGAAARHALVKDVGPRAGSTATVVPVEADDTTGSTPHPSPVVLVGIEGGNVRLPYGTTPMGRSTLSVTTQAEVRAGPGSLVRVDGAAVAGGSVVSDGALLTIDGRSWTVRVPAALDPPVSSGPLTVHRSVAGPTEVTSSTCPAVDGVGRIDLPQPPAAVRPPGLPVLTATVPLLMGAVLWAVTRSPTAAMFVVLSFVFVVASGLEARREARAEDRFRVAEFFDDLDDVRAALDADARRQRSGLDLTTPATVELLRWLPTTGPADPRVWWRSSDCRRTPKTVVRLGDGSVRRDTQLGMPSGGRRSLRRHIEELFDGSGMIDAAVTLDLACTGGIALVGDSRRCHAVARSLLMQLCVAIGPDQIVVEVAVSSARRSQWRWTGWLPHARSTVTEGATVTITDDPDLRHAARHDGQIFIAIGASEVEVPVTVDAVLGVDSGILRIRSTRHLGGHHDDLDSHLVHVEDLALDEAEPAARVLCGLRPSTGQVTDSQSTAAFTDLLSHAGALDDPAEVVAAWSEAPIGRLVAPIGIADGGGVVNLDLVADGPHALIAGTTGSGKSELLRTLLVSLALHHPPDQLSFLLVDYKGGAAFRPISSLPHSVGLVTDLSPALARRAITSLRAEIRRREEWLAHQGLDDLNDAGSTSDSGRPAAMVIVVDEFATMAREIPDFVDGLVDIAQRGRSLGIHLVLATQRPAGVVTDAIRANTSIRLALRVTDEDDSRDVVDTPEAAALQQDRPGRAVIRLGLGRTATVQAAHTGAAMSESHRARVRLLHGSTDDRAPDTWTSQRSTTAGSGSRCTVLSAAVANICEAARLEACAPARAPWAPPLPNHLTTEETQDIGDGITLGLMDLPDQQRHGSLRFDPVHHRGIAVIGASGSGRSTTLAATAHAVRSSDPDAVVLAVTDDALLSASAVAGDGDAVRHEDIERVRRMLRVVETELLRRRSGVGITDRAGGLWLVVIDGIATFEELHDGIDRGAAMDALARIARDGPSSGIHLAVAANRRGDLGPSLSTALGLELLLRGGDDPAGLATSGTGDVTPGRCRAGDVDAQIAHPPPPPPPDPGRRVQIHRSPTRVRLSELDSSPAPPALDAIPIGIDVDTLGTVHLDLEHHHGFVVGMPRSGRSTALDSIARWAEAAGLRATTVNLATSPRLRTEMIAAAIDDAPPEQPSLLLLDDLPLLLDADLDGEIEQLLGRVLEVSRTRPLRTVVAGDPTALMACYSDPVRRMRSGRTGLTLGVADDLGPDILYSSVPRRGDVPEAAGRGWLINRGHHTLIQAPLR